MGTGPGAGPRAARVMIVDNAPFAVDRLKKILEEHGYPVVAEAKDTASAVSNYKKYKPDVVTLDLLLDGDHGFRTLSALQKVDPKARIIIVSAVGDQATIEKAYALGAAGFVTKAEDWNQFKAALDKATSAQGLGG